MANETQERRVYIQRAELYRQIDALGNYGLTVVRDLVFNGVVVFFLLFDDRLGYVLGLLLPLIELFRLVLEEYLVDEFLNLLPVLLQQVYAHTHRT